MGVLQECVEPRSVRSRRTGRFHRGYLRVVMFDGKIVAAIYRLDPEPDDGTFHDPTRTDAPALYEAAPPDEEARLQEQLGPFVGEIERQFREQIHTDADLTALKQRWLRGQTAV